MIQNAVIEKEFLPLRTIERVAIAFSIIALIAALYFKPTLPVIAGLAAGSVIGIANFRLLKRLVIKMTAEQSAGKSRNNLRFFIKIVFLAAIIGTLIFFVKVNIVAFLVGFSSIVFGIFYEGIKELF